MGILDILQDGEYYTQQQTKFLKNVVQNCLAYDSVARWDSRMLRQVFEQQSRANEEMKIPSEVLSTQGGHSSS